MAIYHSSKSPLLVSLMVVVGAWLLPSGARAAAFDHRLTRNTGGIYSLQDAVPISMGLLTAGCSLWQGTTNELGKSCWKAGEAGVVSILLTESLQLITRRESPATTSDPNHWFTGGKGSFPSNHVSLTTAIVTPFILQYVHKNPWVAALAVLPAYEIVARVKAQEHWQTDVVAGAALGFAIGAFEQHRNNPLIFSVLPGGGFVGFHKTL